ncbi:signal recognition particle subunit SRP19, partial [Tremellales sp. Uapishka_1]
MPTVEDYFDDDTDLPLPASSSSRLPSTGLQGALLEEIDYSQLADQSRSVFGENARAPPPGVNKGKSVVRHDDSDELRPSAPANSQMNPNTPMGGFMGDMMKLQAVEEERMKKLRQQMGATQMAKDPSVYKTWNAVYPLYFDAKVSINSGRRVPRNKAVWWPQAVQIAKACSVLGLPSVLEPDKQHPADWANPGRVKVQFEKDGRFLNPIVKNRTQLYQHLAAQIQHVNPSLVPQPASTTSKTPKLNATKTKTKTKSTKPPRPPMKAPSKPPQPPQPVPSLDDRLPLHSPIVPAGVALSSIKRDLENEREAKKRGVLPAAEEGGKDKTPKVKRMVVRGKR